MPAITVSVTVPEDTVQQLLSYAASLWGGSAAPASRAAAAPVSRAAIPNTQEVRSAFEGGTSSFWRPFLVFFAGRPDQWVHMAEGFDAVGLTGPQGVGMVGAAERRCRGNGYMPYEKRWGRDGKAEVRMSTDVATEILRLDAASGV